MKSSLLHTRESATPAIIELLESVTLGTNGAHYRHLDTRSRIFEADRPLFLTIERNEKILGNVTFCRRDQNWYIRYFAFDNRFQSKGAKKSSGNSLIKREIESFFQKVLDQQEPVSFYAYIDPDNVKSLWMSENFGFETIARIATQSFSRVNPRNSIRIEKLTDWNEVKLIIQSNFGNHLYYFEAQTSKPPFYVLKDDNEIIAFAKTNAATWEIKRLPGKFGGMLTRLIPFIPRLNKIIRPKNHAFIVPEAVWVKNNDPGILEELFEGILFEEKRNLLLWWVDEKDRLYKTIQPKTDWGILHKLIGISLAHVVQRTNSEQKRSINNQPVYTSGFDFI